ARVLGQAVASVKHPSLHGWRLLVVQPLTADAKEDGEPLLAIDQLGAGRADLVLVSNDGGGARELVGNKNSPVRWFGMGLCDAWGPRDGPNLPGAMRSSAGRTRCWRSPYRRCAATGPSRSRWTAATARRAAGCVRLPAACRTARAGAPCCSATTPG